MRVPGVKGEGKIHHRRREEREYPRVKAASLPGVRKKMALGPEEKGRVL